MLNLPLIYFCNSNSTVWLICRTNVCLDFQCSFKMYFYPADIVVVVFFFLPLSRFENFPARFKMKIHSKDSGAVRRIFDMGKFALYIIFWISETTTTPKDLYYSKKDNNFKFSKNNWKYISPVRKLIKCRWAFPWANYCYF